MVARVDGANGQRGQPAQHQHTAQRAQGVAIASVIRHLQHTVLGFAR